eukprot:SAG22_NODE_218_length_14885_cov_24.733699_5_plen_1447_part_00
MFEAAADEAHRYGFWLYEAFALRDLKVCVLDGLGHGEHGARRLGVALRQLTAPADMLTPLLDGLDAAELMGLPVPEAGYTVVFSTEDAAAVALRHELQDLRLMALHKRAVDDGVLSQSVEDGMNSDNPKAELTEMIVAQQKESANSRDQELQQLREELQGLRLMELHKRAVAAGVAHNLLEDAMDSDSPKDSVTLLVLAAPRAETPANTSDRPHFGSTAAAPATTEVQQHTGKHVMLSYQWDHQRSVMRVQEHLSRLGVKCWMDISGGMGSDIYDSMAQGVSSASVVVCFMSQKYQDSANCTLEAKFAKQSGIEIIPVIMEGGGWQASGWLGLLTAGALWVPLHEEADFEQNVRQLHTQLLKTIGSSAAFAAEDGDTVAAVASSTEAIEELERLREEQAAPSSQSTVSAALADPSQPANIPAGVPKLPVRFQATEQIRELTRLVLSESRSDMAMPRVGFYGMGGIGKTVTGAAIVRDDGVRRHFDAIVWLPIGQTPVVAKLQNLCHMQCTGKELSAELSSEEKKQALQQAMAGKKVLLCLDDIWEEAAETELNFADVSAGSKVLISTRMKALLAGGHQVEVGLPSPADSARMLLAAADAESGNGEPTGVHEIVDLCGRLPLALGIAGRLAANLGLPGTQDWSDMIGVLKEELRESHSGGTEEGMIRASLRGLKGSAREQENVKALLKMFALVPEDTHCPLQVLLLMFKATMKDSGAVSIMHIRKWLRVLIDRSLVLGTIDRPSVHDLVLDFAAAQHSVDALREQHRAIVNAFREARPADVHGRHKFEASQRDSSICAYVTTEISHHLREGWELPMERDKVAMTAWLGDVPQDEIVVAAGLMIGCESLEQAAASAEAGGDFWLAGRYWSIASIVVHKTRGLAETKEPAKKALDALAMVDSSVQLDDVHDMQLDRLLCFGLLLDTPAIMARSKEMDKVLASQAAVRDPLKAAYLVYIARAPPLFFSNDVQAFARVLVDFWERLRNGMYNDADPAQQYLCSQHCWNVQFCIEVPLSAQAPGCGLDWDFWFGARAERLVASIRSYDYDRVHASLRESFNVDLVMVVPSSLIPLSLHYGDVSAAHEYAEQSLQAMRRSMAEPDQEPEILGVYWGAQYMWGFWMGLGLVSTDHQNAIVKLFVEQGLTWDGAEATIDSLPHPLVRKRGDRNAGAYLMTAESVTWKCKCAYVVLANRGVTKSQVLQSLPSVEEVISFECTEAEVGSVTTAWTGAWCNIWVYLALMCSKLECWAEALRYATAATDPDLKRAGCRTCVTRTVGLLLQGRANAALGKMVEAARQLEAAAEEAHRRGLWLLEVFAIRDLKLCVLGETGRGDHDSRRLGAALRLLTSPAELLTPLVMGLDAAELVALDPPDVPASSELITVTPAPNSDAADSQDLGTLRAELAPLKLSQLRKRAVGTGADEAVIEGAEDEDEPKAALVELIIRHERTGR